MREERQMPALISYVVAVAVFLGGGYWSLNFLAGNFEEPRRATSYTSGQAQQPKAVRIPDPVPAQAIGTPAPGSDTSNVKSPETKLPESSTPDAPLVAAITPDENVNEQSHAMQSHVGQSDAQSVRPNDRDVTKANGDGSTEIDKPSASQTATRVDSSSANADEPHQLETADSRVQTVKPDNGDSGLQPGPAPPKAKTTQTVKNASSDERLRSAISGIRPIVQPRPAKAPRVAQKKKTEPVLMVLQTIEYPDGRREQRLVSQRQAQMTD